MKCLILLMMVILAGCGTTKQEGINEQYNKNFQVIKSAYNEQIRKVTDLDARVKKIETEKPAAQECPACECPECPVPAVEEVKNEEVA